jgi:hypothetical protein
VAARGECERRFYTVNVVLFAFWGFGGIIVWESLYYDEEERPWQKKRR